MADRLNFYFRQRVTESELDEAFELLERSVHTLAADLGVYGILSGAVPAPHDPLPDLSVDLTAPTSSYDRLGQRIAFGSDQTVDCSVDAHGLSTSVSNVGDERWLGVFLKFDRVLSDPRTDGNSQVVMFRRDESFRFVVRQGAPAPVGTATKVPLEPDELLVCDIQRLNGQSQIQAEHIDISRRQHFVFAQSSAVGVDTGGWTTIVPPVADVQHTLDKIDEELTGHFLGTEPRHQATAIDISPYGFVEATTVEGAVQDIVGEIESIDASSINATPHAHIDGTTVQAQLEEVVSEAASQSASSSGTRLIGGEAVPASPYSLVEGTLFDQLVQLLGHSNAHYHDAIGAHLASAIRVFDSSNMLDADDVESSLLEILQGIEGGHFLQNSSNPGQHKAIVQPILGSPDDRVLLWHSKGVGASPTTLRIYADAVRVWFVLNARWDEVGGEWMPDNIQNSSGGFYMAPGVFAVVYTGSGTGNFSVWTSERRIPISDDISNSGFEAMGPTREVGRVALHLNNPHSSGHTVSSVCAVTFRTRFPATPSSITLTQTDAISTWPSLPLINDADKDGFGAYQYIYIPAGENWWWYGHYLAVV